MNSDDLVERILSNNRKQRAEAFTTLYSKCFPKVKQHVLKNSGTDEEARDLFQEAITVTYYNLLNHKFRGESSIGQYVIGIARNLWLLKLRKKTLPTTPLEDQQIAVEEFPERVDAGLLTRIMTQLNQGCQTILRSFYYEGESMEDIAKKLNLGSAQAAKTKKLRCMKKLTGLIEAYGLKDHDFRQ